MQSNSINFRNGQDMTNHSVATNMRPLDFQNLTTTRRGLSLIKLRWMDVVDFSNYAEVDLINSNLENESTIMVPLFAIKYNWTGSGKTYYSY